MKKIYTLLFLIPITFTCLFSQIEGTWKMAPIAQAMAVGPNMGDFSWWSNSTGDVDTRACFFDDQFVFNADGTFQNIQDGETWLEVWQGVAEDGCGTSVAPHDGSNAATWTDNGDGTLTLTGVGAHLGLPKVHNAGELTSPGDAPGSITYPFVIDGTTMTIDIDFGGGFWHFVLQKEGTTNNPQTIPLTFEDADVDYSAIGFGLANGEIIANPDASGINTSATVAHINKAEGAETWAGTTFPLGEVIDLSLSSTFEIKIWSPRAGVPILFKIEDTTSPPDGNGNPSVIAEVQVNTTTANAWETLMFDMSLFPDYNSTNPYNQAIVFPDFGSMGVTGGESFYVDDIQVTGDVAINETELAKVKMNAFPNPTDNQLNVSFDIPVSGNVTLTMVDVLGRTTKHTGFGNLIAGEYLEELSVNTMSAGTYVLLLRLDGQLIKSENLVIK